MWSCYIIDESGSGLLVYQVISVIYLNFNWELTFDLDNFPLWGIRCEDNILFSKFDQVTAWIIEPTVSWIITWLVHLSVGEIRNEEPRAQQCRAVRKIKIQQQNNQIKYQKNHELFVSLTELFGKIQPYLHDQFVTLSCSCHVPAKQSPPLLVVFFVVKM